MIIRKNDEEIKKFKHENKQKGINFLGCNIRLKFLDFFR